MTDFEVGLRLTADGRAVVTTSRAVAREVDRYGDAAERAGSQAERSGRRSEVMGRRLAGAGREARQARVEMGGLTSQLTQLRNVAAGIAGLSFVGGIGAGVRAATRESLSYSDALAEVSTLLEGTREEMELLTRASRAQAEQFGSTPTAQANALYQIVSAGASDAREAIELLDASNRLAVGGVTDVQTAANGLTTVLNSYGLEAGMATSVSDALFLAMRSGKTTIGELSDEFSTAGPLAAQVGLGFEPLLAATAALTLNGTNTNVAMTGLRQVLATVIKPSSEARDEARSLGIEFDTAALRAKGFAGFLREIVEANGGAEDSLGRLFGNVESLVPVLALVGSQGGDFAEILERMEHRAGLTEDAVAKMMAALGNREQQAISSIRDQFLDLGAALAGEYVESLEAVSDNLDTVGIAATGVATVLAGRLTASLGVGALAAFVAANRAAIAGLVLSARVAPAAALGFTGVATAATAARGALALLGGPVGIAATAAATIYIYRDALFEAATASERQTSALSELNGRLEESRRLTVDQTEALLLSTRASTESAIARREEARAELELARARVASARRQTGPGGFLGTTAGGVNASREVSVLQAALESLDVEIAGNLEVIESLQLRLIELQQTQVAVADATVEAGTVLAGAADDAEEFARKLAGVIAGLDPAAARAAQYSEQVQILARAHQEGAISGERLADLVSRLNAEIYPTSEGFLEAINQQLLEEQRLLGLGNLEREVELDVRRRVLEAQAAGIELSEAEIEQLREWIRSTKEAEAAAARREEIERRSAEEIVDVWREARRRVQAVTADVLVDALDGNLDDVEDIADRFVDIWKRAYAEAFAARLFQEGVAGTGGPLNVGSLFGQQGPGATPELNIPGLGSLDEALGGLTNSLDAFGTKLGFAAPVPAGGPPVAGAGPMLSGALGTGLQTLGTAGIAFGVGSGLGDLLGIGTRGSNTLGGAAAGAAIGSVVPGIGTAIGAIVGGIGGLLAGNGGNNPFVEADVSGGGLGGVRQFDGADHTVAIALRDAVDQSLGAIADAFGTGVSARNFGIVGSSESGFSFRTAGTTHDNRTIFPSADAAVVAAIREGVRSGIVEGIDENARTVVANSSATTAEGLLADLEFVDSYTALLEAGRESSRFASQLRDLNDTFVDAIARAHELGLETEALGEARERAQGRFREDFERETRLAILDLTDPVRAALERQQQESRQFLLDAAAVGADLDLARRRVRLDREALIAELTAGTDRLAAAFREDLDGILEDLRFGEQSGLADQERLPLLLERFQDLAARAPFEEAARADLDGATGTLLDVAGDVFASSSDFFEIQRQVEAQLEALRDAGITTPDVQAIADEIGQIELDPEFQQLMGEIGDEIAEGNAQVVDLLTQIRDGLGATATPTSPFPGTVLAGALGGGRGLEL